MIRKFIIFLFVGFVVALPLKTWAVVLEDFDSLNTGQLNGQGGWSGGTDTQVTSDTNQSGTRAVGKTGGGGITDTKKSITPLNTDTSLISCYVRSTTVNNGGGGAFGCRFYEDSTTLFTLRFNDEGNQLEVTGNSTVQLMAGPSANTWYKLELEVDFTNDSARARVNGGSWSSSFSAVGVAAFSQINYIGTQFGGLAGSAYLDTYEATYAEGGGEEEPPPVVGSIDDLLDVVETTFEEDLNFSFTNFQEVFTNIPKIVIGSASGVLALVMPYIIALIFIASVVFFVYRGFKFFKT